MKNWLGIIRKPHFYLIAGLLNIGSVLLLWHINNPAISYRPATVSAQTRIVPPAVKIVSGKPTRIVIPRLGLDLPIDEGYYNAGDGSWTLSDYNAQFAMPTVLANDHDGNTLIYGHNSSFVFGRLNQLQPGDMIEVTTREKHIFRYKFQSAENVAPDNLSTFAYQGPPIVTLQTCSGNWNELRRMSVFALVSTTEFDPVAAAAKENIENLKSNLSRHIAPQDKPQYLPF